MSDILEKWRNNSIVKARPLQASLELTYRCNERCQHCYIPEYRDDPKRILKKEDWYTVLEKLRDGGVINIVLLGGEAMLSRHFWPITEKAKELGFHQSMITNGLLINERNVKHLAHNGMQQVTFSIYSLNPEVHDDLTRYPGSLAATMKALDLCQKEGIEVAVNCLLMNKNIKDYFELADWGKEREIIVKADPLVTAKFDGNLEPLFLRADKEDLEAFYEESARRYSDNHLQPETSPKESFLCSAGKGKCAVNPYGDLLACLEIREPLGNLLQSSFAEIWESEQARKWRSFRFEDFHNANPNTDDIDYCQHCPGMALHESGNPLKSTPYDKTLAKIKSQIKARRDLEGRN